MICADSEVASLDAAGMKYFFLCIREHFIWTFRDILLCKIWQLEFVLKPGQLTEDSENITACVIC